MLALSAWPLHVHLVSPPPYNRCICAKAFVFFTSCRPRQPHPRRPACSCTMASPASFCMSFAGVMLDTRSFRVSCWRIDTGKLGHQLFFPALPLPAAHCALWVPCQMIFVWPLSRRTVVTPVNEMTIDAVVKKESHAIVAVVGAQLWRNYTFDFGHS